MRPCQPARAKSDLIEEPVAAALGAGSAGGRNPRQHDCRYWRRHVEVAVMSMGGVVVSRSLRVAGDEMDQDIVQYMRNKYNLFIGERMAEQAKIAIGSAYHLTKKRRWCYAAAT